ncbi:peptidylprolyl isomerase [Sphingobium sp. SCG-1]|uniref:peptidylprolyl isomerase n=1 Tax=Sphingobium sp. SCG-1 TaxID=2072936 RepID=UPI000CD699CE|nr:peptidylprolyl isomerase [Sphingobium sp. SCG-1]AUW60008.1 peptidylprolyl isomerase [Sphingobium sp. SCG-1]
MRFSLRSAFQILLVSLAAPALAQSPAKEVTPASVIADAPAAAWKAIPPADLLVMTLAGGRGVVIQLAPLFSQGHVGNMRVLALAHWWDGTSVYRVQDNYVAQWGDRSEKKPLPQGMKGPLPQDYSISYNGARKMTQLPGRDSYAPVAGFIDGWPVASDRRQAWLTHCYGSVGIGRNGPPDAGTGAELYAVIGHAPRQLDRNIAVVGRVIDGIAHLSSLPRGTAEIGMYGPQQEATPILSVRLASDMPETERPKFEVMDTGSKSFADYMHVRANRKDDFYILPAGGVDICNVPVPIRTVN